MIVHPLQVIDEPIREAEHDFSVDLIVTCVIGIIGQRGGHQGPGSQMITPAAEPVIE